MKSNKVSVLICTSYIILSIILLPFFLIGVILDCLFELDNHKDYHFRL